MAQRVLRNLAQCVKEFFGQSGSSVLDTQQGIEAPQSGKIGIDKIYYLHMRMYDKNNNLLPWGGSTIAYRVTKDFAEEEYDIGGSLSTGDEILYFLDIGISNCRYSDKSKDLFCKRIGRDIALARLLDTDKQTDGGYYINHPTHSDIINAVKNIYYHVREEFVPQVRLMVKG